MSNPSINEFLIELNCLLDCLVARLVVYVRVEVGYAICRRHHMDDSFVAPITKLNSTPMSLIKKCLPHFIRCVSLTIHNSAVAKNDSRFVTFKSCLKEDILEAHLRLHYLDLEAHLVHQCHLVRLDKAPTLHHQSGSLRHDKNFETFLCQVISNSGERRCLAGAWTSSQTHTVDGVLRRRHYLRVIQMRVKHSLRYI